jgi:hypothetical protein
MSKYKTIYEILEEHDIYTFKCIKQEQTQCPVEEKLRDSIMKRKMGVVL